jgi:hypothetical protein
MMKHMTRIERIIPFLMDGLAALVGGVGATGALLVAASTIADLLPGAKSIAALFLVITTAGALVAVRIARWSIRDQVHMELAESGK